MGSNQTAKKVRSDRVSLSEPAENWSAANLPESEPSGRLEGSGRLGEPAPRLPLALGLAAALAVSLVLWALIFWGAHALWR